MLQFLNVYIFFLYKLRLTISYTFHKLQWFYAWKYECVLPPVFLMSQNQKHSILNFITRLVSVFSISSITVSISVRYVIFSSCVWRLLPELPPTFLCVPWMFHSDERQWATHSTYFRHFSYSNILSLVPLGLCISSKAHFLQNSFNFSLAICSLHHSNRLSEKIAESTLF